MNTQRTPMLAFVVAALLATACEKSPNAEVKSAETELTSEQRKAQQEQANLQNKQLEERAEKQGAKQDEQAELRRKHDSERADTHAEGQLGVSGAEKGVVNARENMAQDRRDFDTKSRERISKLDAKKKQEFTTYLSRYQNERGVLTNKVNSLSNVSDENWQNAKKEIEQKLDLLEGTTDKLEKDL